MRGCRVSPFITHTLILLVISFAAEGGNGFLVWFSAGGWSAGHALHALYAVWMETFSAAVSIALPEGHRGDSPATYDHFPLSERFSFNGQVSRGT